ncbi:MAG: PAS domain-containing protein [Bacteroidetes bacterium]|nr:PAS domain-containing protein [Bacteroidota bacterium]
MRKNYLKIILPTILSILLFILTIFLIIIPHFQQNIMNGKREMIKELTNSAWSILAKYEKDEKEGILTREMAQKNAISRIQYLRYGEENKDYFWVTDIKPTMIMHPFRADLNGKDLSDFSDPHGKKLFVEFVNTVKKSDHGYVDYMWQWKDDSLHIVPKLSYVRIFKPWNWVIGTGIYIEDVKKEISVLTNKMVWISIGISTIIVLLLLYIINQTLNIEHKRIEAENELHESKEKYKTLVEAATEGLIMLIDGKISFSNAVISKMTGYHNSELVNLSLHEIISKSNNKDIINIFSQNTVKEGRYELSLNKKNGGSIEVLITSSNTVFYGKAVNIIIVKDISFDKDQTFSNVDYQKLIGTLNIGFFKARIDHKGKFTFANETTIRILGFNNFAELSETHIFGLIADPDERINLKKNLIDKGFIKSKILRIINRDGSFSVVAISLVLHQNESSGVLLCDGIIEDITQQEQEKNLTNELIARLKVQDLTLEHPVKNYLDEIHSLDSDASLRDVIHLFSKRDTDHLLLTKNEMDFIGIITKNDIQSRILKLNLNLDNPAYLIMSSPIVSVSENTMVIDAIKRCDENYINHLVARNESGGIAGMFKRDNICNGIIKSLSFYLGRVNSAETNEAIKSCYDSLQILLKSIIKSEVSVNIYTSIATAFSDAVLRRVISLATDEIGTSPVRFSFICLGSEGRKEETLFTDQDNAIIYEDVPKENKIAAEEYFKKLGNKICHSLHHIGYSYCKGNIMANNPQWCQPISTWEEYFTTWIASPESQNLLDAMIFFDFRTVFGEESFSDRLRYVIANSIKVNPLFLYHLAHNIYSIKYPHISSGNILSDKNAEHIDLKNALAPFIMFARTYSLKNDIRDTNTLDRLSALKNSRIIAGDTIDELVFAYGFLMKLRLRNQVYLSENKAQLSNSLGFKRLLELELHLLKKVISVIPDIQNKIKLDFRIST